MLLLGACFILLLLPSVLPAMNQFRSTDFTEQHGTVTTAAGVTSANVTLSQDLFEDRTSEVSEITSTFVNDFPIASTYTTASNKLLVIGLAASENRTLTIKYKIGRLDDYVGADVGATTWPLMLLLGVLGVIGASIYVAYKKE